MLHRPPFLPLWEKPYCMHSAYCKVEKIIRNNYKWPTNLHTVFIVKPTLPSEFSPAWVELSTTNMVETVIGAMSDLSGHPSGEEWNKWNSQDELNLLYKVIFMKATWHEVLSCSNIFSFALWSILLASSESSTAFCFAVHQCFFSLDDASTALRSSSYYVMWVTKSQSMFFSRTIYVWGPSLSFFSLAISGTLENSSWDRKMFFGICFTILGGVERLQSALR